MRSFWLVVATVAQLAHGSIARADASAPIAPAATRHARATLIDGADAVAGAAQDLDPVGEGIVVGEHARIETPRGPIHVWTPRGYDPETAMTVVYVHGYAIDVDDAWWGHGLPEQFGHASINAMFIACEAPQQKWQSVNWRSLTALLGAVEASGRALPKGRVAAIGHSGAYRTLEYWVRDPRLDTLAMLDAGYGYLGWVRTWILGDANRRLINVGDDTVMFTDYLHRYLPQTVKLQGFSAFSDRAQVERLARERIVYVRSRVGHHNLAFGALALPSVLRILGAPSIDRTAP
jgi:hypothetical protein